MAGCVTAPRSSTVGTPPNLSQEEAKEAFLDLVKKAEVRHEGFFIDAMDDIKIEADRIDFVLRVFEKDRSSTYSCRFESIDEPRARFSYLRPAVVFGKGCDMAFYFKTMDEASRFSAALSILKHLQAKDPTPDKEKAN